MNIHITGRQINITKPIKSHIESRLKKLDRFIDGITDINVVLSVEKYRQIADVKIHCRGNTYLTAIEESNDLYVSIAQAVEKVESQAKKQQKKRYDKRRRAGRKEASGTFNVLSSEATGPSPPSPPSPNESPRLIESSRFVIKPLSVEEAIWEMEDEKGEFLVFRDASSNRVNVIYRRKDGNYGLIDPDNR